MPSLNDLNEIPSIVVRLLHSLNMLYKLELLVSSSGTDVRLVQPENICCIVFTLLVLNAGIVVILLQP